MCCVFILLLTLLNVRMAHCGGFSQTHQAEEAKTQHVERVQREDSTGLLDIALVIQFCSYGEFTSVFL